MLPQIVTMDEFPLTPGGKIAVGQLPRPARKREESSNAPPVHAVAARTTGILRCTRSDHVDPDRSFLDLGGHSPIAGSAEGMIQRQFGQRLSLASLYKASAAQKIEALSGKSDNGEIVNCLVPSQPHGRMPPLFAIHALGEQDIFFRRMAPAPFASAMRNSCPKTRRLWFRQGLPLSGLHPSAFRRLPLSVTGLLLASPKHRRDPASQ